MPTMTASFEKRGIKDWKKKYVELDFMVSIGELERLAEQLRELTCQEWGKQYSKKKDTKFLNNVMHPCQAYLERRGLQVEWKAFEKAHNQVFELYMAKRRKKVVE